MDKWINYLNLLKNGQVGVTNKLLVKKDTEINICCEFLM
jgi:hypothetical protein